MDQPNDSRSLAVRDLGIFDFKLCCIRIYYTPTRKGFPNLRER
jgi:hypothetical protein